MKACFSQKTSLIVMIFMTASFFLAEIIVGYITNSMALVADSFHMLSDVVSLFVGFFALKISQQEHGNNLNKNTFGWVRAEVLGALVNSVFLVALCFSILVESLKRLVEPEGITEPLLVLGVGAAGLVINLIGMFIFQGHLGHGHSHGGGGHGHSHGGGGHGHSHGGGGHSHGGGGHGHGGHGNEEHGNGKHGHEKENADKKIVIHSSNANQTFLSHEDEMTAVVIVNRQMPPSSNLEKEQSIQNGGPEENQRVSRRNSRRSSRSSSTGLSPMSSLTPTRYKMGMYLAALHAEEAALHSGEVQVEQERVEIDLTGDNSIEAKKSKQTSSDQMNMRGVYLHVLGDALGSVIVIISALTIYFAKGKWTLYVDPVMSILMVMIILKTSLPLLKESSMILLQTVPTHIQIQDVEQRLLVKFPSIMEIHEFHVWQLAGNKVIASLHLKFPTKGDYTTVSESIKAFFHDEGIHSTTIQPEFLEEVKPTTQRNSCLFECVSNDCKEMVCCKPGVRARLNQKTLQDLPEVESQGETADVDEINTGLNNGSYINDVIDDKSSHVSDTSNNGTHGEQQTDNLNDDGSSHVIEVNDSGSSRDIDENNAVHHPNQDASQTEIAIDVTE